MWPFIEFDKIGIIGEPKTLEQIRRYFKRIKIPPEYAVTILYKKNGQIVKGHIFTKEWPTNRVVLEFGGDEIEEYESEGRRDDKVKIAYMDIGSYIGDYKAHIVLYSDQFKNVKEVRKDSF